MARKATTGSIARGLRVAALFTPGIAGLAEVQADFASDNVTLLSHISPQSFRRQQVARLLPSHESKSGERLEDGRDRGADVHRMARAFDNGQPSALRSANRRGVCPRDARRLNHLPGASCSIISVDTWFPRMEVPL